MHKPLTDHAIAYRWAFNEIGYPIPINEAQRGHSYTCPLCHGQMIPRLGAQLQHHFGHENKTGCTPEAVARAALRRWITLQLRAALQNKQMVPLRWKCTKCGQPHNVDLLKDITKIIEGYQWEQHLADVALTDAAGNVRAVVLIEDDMHPPPATLDFFVRRNDLYTVLIPGSLEPAGIDFVGMMQQGKLAGAACPMFNSMGTIIKEPEAVRNALREVVMRWPGYFSGALETIGSLNSLLRVGNQILWLPVEHWQQVVGGSRNRLAPGVQIMIQTWSHTDGSTIWLYYVTARDSAAVAVRRYAPGHRPIPYLDQRFRRRRVTALDIANYLILQAGAN